MLCISCHNPKATLACGICKSTVCKNCAQFVGEEAFSFLAEVPEELSHRVYCGPCFDQKVSEELKSYKKIMKQAKEVFVFYSTQGKETRGFKRTEWPIKIKNCVDRDQTVMRLAFLAVKAGFNALVDVEITYEKTRVDEYQKTMWHGTGIPVLADPSKMNRLLPK